MKNWNPVAGLKEITSNQLRKGDVIILRSQDEKSFTEHTIEHPGAWPSDMREKMWLLDRPYPEEPDKAGTIIRIRAGNGSSGYSYYVRLAEYSYPEETCYWCPLSEAEDVSGYTVSWEHIVDCAIQGNVEIVREGIYLEW